MNSSFLHHPAEIQLSQFRPLLHQASSLGLKAQTTASAVEITPFMPKKSVDRLNSRPKGLPNAEISGVCGSNFGVFNSVPWHRLPSPPPRTADCLGHWNSWAGDSQAREMLVEVVDLEMMCSHIRTAFSTLRAAESDFRGSVNRPACRLMKGLPFGNS